MTVNINAANITSIRLADQVTPPTGVATNFINLYADTNGDIATVKGGGGGIKITTSPATGNYTLTVDGTGTAARLNANQTFTGINTFNQNIVFPSGVGISFAATSEAGGMTSEILADYEEGTWTPTLTGNDTPGTYTFSASNALYTRVGRQVSVSARLTVGTASGGLGVAKFGGLPFTKGANQAYVGAIVMSGVDTTAGTISLAVQAFSTISSSSEFSVVQMQDNAASVTLDIAGIASGDSLFFSFTYFV